MQIGQTGVCVCEPGRHCGAVARAFVYLEWGVGCGEQVRAGHTPQTQTKNKKEKEKKKAEGLLLQPQAHQEEEEEAEEEDGGGGEESV